MRVKKKEALATKSTRENDIYMHPIYPSIPLYKPINRKNEISLIHKPVTFDVV
jgi:hypothetical protein